MTKLAHVLMLTGALGCGADALAPSEPAPSDDGGGGSSPSAAGGGTGGVPIGEGGGSAAASSGAGGGEALPIGTATLAQSTQCPSSSVPTSACFEVTVTDCADVADLVAVVKVSEPPAGSSAGTVLLGNGAGGVGFYEQYGPPAVTGVIEPLLAAGYRVVQRSWQGGGELGWMTGPGGSRKLACRYATLLDAVHEEIHTGGAMCASGNSGGSSEIAYALAHYGMASVLDMALLSSGPPMARIDYGCLGESAWGSECAALNPGCNGSWCCSYGGAAAWMDATYGPTVSGCATMSPTMAAAWLEDSVLAPTASLVYPSTTVRFVFGGDDDGAAATLGKLYAQAIAGATITTVPSVPHEAPTTNAGAQEIFAELAQDCIER